MKNIVIAGLFIFGWNLCALGHDFKGKASLDSVAHTGYYKISLSPDVVSYLKEDYADIRIFDSKAKEIPYILQAEAPFQNQTELTLYPILENKYIPTKAITRIVVHNPSRSAISRFILTLRNAAVEKEITLKGSDNKQDWFIIQRNYIVHASAVDNETSEMRMVDFPVSNYEYFEISLNDKKKDPVQVISVGNYTSGIFRGRYTEIPNLKFNLTTNDSLKQSTIQLIFRRPYEISKLSFEISSPALYKRNCQLGKLLKVGNHQIFESISSFSLQTGEANSLVIDPLKADTIVIRIENEDNVPLQITGIKAFQLNKYLIARLDAGEKYNLMFGNTDLKAPSYDLHYFSDSIPKNIPILQTGALRLIAETQVKSISHGFTQKIVWAVLVLVIIGLGFLTVKLTREMKSKD